jgi:putative addiction module component (TIGR02574 family)
MSQTLLIPPPGFDTVSVEEQIDYVQALWDHIAARPEAIPVPDWHREILAERLGAYDANTDEGKTWDDFEDELTREIQCRSSGR